MTIDQSIVILARDRFGWNITEQDSEYRFAVALLEQHRQSMYQAAMTAAGNAIDTAMAMEREANATVVENAGHPELAQAIRRRAMND